MARNTNLVMRAEKAGTVTYADSQVVVVDDEEYRLTKYRGLMRIPPVEVRREAF